MPEDSLQSNPAEALPQTTAPDQPRSQKMIRFILDVVETLIISLVLFAGINAITVRIRVDGHSMEPTLQNGELVIVNKLAYRFSAPKAGDVIVFRFPRDPDQEYIKRIIGLPGDEVKIANGQVFINGKQAAEPYIAAPPAYNMIWQVPEGTVFVLGDNRNNSSDSHDWGPVAMEYVVGKAVFIYWPPQAWGAIRSYDLSAASP